jgi:hypothetical protein
VLYKKQYKYDPSDSKFTLEVTDIGNNKPQNHYYKIWIFNNRNMNIWFPTVYNRICTEYFLINAIYCNITTQIIFRKKTKLKICTFYETGNKQREKLFMLQIWQERYGNMCNSSIKTLISNLLHTARFWDNLHQVRSISKYWKAK